MSALARANSFGAQGLANLISGLASIGACGIDGVANKLARCLLGRLGAFGAQELSNSLSGLAKLGARLDACGALASEASVALRAMVDPRAARRCTPQNLANAAWSATKLLELARRGGGGGSLGFWALFAPTVTARVAELNALELSTCAWAAAHGLAHATHDVGAAVPALCAALAAKASVLALAGEMSPQQLATVALSLCKMGCVNREALKAVEDAARKRIKEFTPQDLDNLASGFARHELQWKSKKLVVALALQGAAAVARKDDVGGDAFFQNMERVAPPRNVANLLTAVAKLASTAKCCGCQGARTFANASAAALVEAGRLDAFNLKDLANAAWGLAILGREANEKIAACMRRIGCAAVPLLAAGGSVGSASGASAESGASDGVFLAQECSRLLYAMGTAAVSCPELEAAAGEERELSFAFHAPVGAVTLRQVFGGTHGEYLKREETGAIAGNGGALFEDAYVLAEVSVMLCTVTFYANLAHSLTRSPSHI